MTKNIKYEVVEFTRVRDGRDRRSTSRSRERERERDRDSSQDRDESAQNLINELRAENESLRNQLNANHSEGTNATTQLHAELRAVKHENEQLRKQLQAEEQLRVSWQDRYENLRVEHQRALQQSSSPTKNTTQTITHHTEIETNRFYTEIRSLTTTVEELQRRLTDETARVAFYEGQLKSKQEEVEDLRKHRDNLTRLWGEYNAANNSEIENLKSQVSIRDVEIENLKSQLNDRVQAALAELRAFEMNSYQQRPPTPTRGENYSGSPLGYDDREAQSPKREKMEEVTCYEKKYSKTRADLLRKFYKCYEQTERVFKTASQIVRRLANVKGPVVPARDLQAVVEMTADELSKCIQEMHLIISLYFTSPEKMTVGCPANKFPPPKGIPLPLLDEFVIRRTMTSSPVFEQ